MAKKYIAASLIELDDKAFKPGDLMEELSETQESDLLASGMIYEITNLKGNGGNAKDTKKVKELEEACKEKDLKNKEFEALITELKEKNELLIEKVKELEAKATSDAVEKKPAEVKK